MSKSGSPLTELLGQSLGGMVPSFLIYKPNAVLTQQQQHQKWKHLPEKGAGDGDGDRDGAGAAAALS